MEAPGLVVVTHGKLAEELVQAARTILAQPTNLEAVSIAWEDDAEGARARIQDAVKRVDHGLGVLILTDMFGGTPTNLALSFLDPGRLEVITGVNLPMLIKFSTLREEQNFGDTARKIAGQGRAAIQLASELLAGGERKERE
jgi:PTS system mannose-specific IIA component